MPPPPPDESGAGSLKPELEEEQRPPELASASAPEEAREASYEGPRALYRNLGRYSRVAGLVLIVLAVVFIVLSVVTQFIVFEIDSVISFVAALLLFFRDPRARVEAGVLDALQQSTDQLIHELSSRATTGYYYAPTDGSIAGVVLMPTGSGFGGLPAGAPLDHPLDPASKACSLTPPGRALAELYRRESTMSKVTLDAIRASMPEILREEFGIARSAEFDLDGDRVRIVLRHPSSTYECRDTTTTEEGMVGCVVSSFLAVLVCAATGRSLFLDGCDHDREGDTWTVVMRLGPRSLVSS